MTKAKATKKINQVGNSLTINVTREAKMLGLVRGDLVEVTLARNDRLSEWADITDYVAGLLRQYGVTSEQYNVVQFGRIVGHEIQYHISHAKLDMLVDALNDRIDTAVWPIIKTYPVKHWIVLSVEQVGYCPPIIQWRFIIED